MKLNGKKIKEIKVIWFQSRDKTDTLPISNKQKLELTLVSNNRVEEKMNTNCRGL